MMIYLDRNLKQCNKNVREDVGKTILIDICYNKPMTKRLSWSFAFFWLYVTKNPCTKATSFIMFIIA